MGSVLKRGKELKQQNLLVVWNDKDVTYLPDGRIKNVNLDVQLDMTSEKDGEQAAALGQVNPHLKNDVVSGYLGRVRKEPYTSGGRYQRVRAEGRLGLGAARYCGEAADDASQGPEVRQDRRGQGPHRGVQQR